MAIGFPLLLAGVGTPAPAKKGPPEEAKQPETRLPWAITLLAFSVGIGCSLWMGRSAYRTARDYIPGDRVRSEYPSGDWAKPDPIINMVLGAVIGGGFSTVTLVMLVMLIRNALTGTGAKPPVPSPGRAP